MCIRDSQWGNWLGNLSSETLLNSLLLIIGIGFAEELVFRGWLLEELKNQYGLKKAIVFQALAFSIVHVGFDMPFWQMINIEEIGTESGTQQHQVMKTIGIARSTFPGLSLL